MFWLSIVPQERERLGFDRLLDVVERASRFRTESHLDEVLGPLQAAAVGGHPRIGVGKLQDHLLLLLAGDAAEPRDLDRHLLDLLGVEPREHRGGFLLRQRGEQHGGLLDVGHRGAVAVELRAGGADHGRRPQRDCDAGRPSGSPRVRSGA